MNVLALALVFVLARVAVPLPTPHEYHPYVILDQHVRNVLAADWDAHEHDPVEVERAYCITYQQDAWVTAEWVWRVVEIEPATDAEGVTPHSITARCPFGNPHVTLLHVHLFQTCISGSECIRGGTLSVQCYPSPIDRQTLADLHKPFTVIQCARDAWVPVYPDTP